MRTETLRVLKSKRSSVLTAMPITLTSFVRMVCDFLRFYLLLLVMFYQPSLEDRVKIAIAADEHKRNKKHNGKRH
jgi:hypothetical protein